MTEITIPPFPKMGGHGGEPVPKMGGHGGEPTNEGLKEIQKKLQKDGKVSNTWDFADPSWWELVKDLTINIKRNKDGSILVTVNGPNVTVKSGSSKAEPVSKKK